MLGIIYHRHFTHSLLFVPIGGFLVALPWMWKHRHHRRVRRQVLAATLIGYGTHALLDAFTSYGTLLWWPCSHDRVAWSVIAIIDPRYTLPLLVGIYLSAKTRARTWVVVALAWSFFYLGLCTLQRHRALDLQNKLIQARGAKANERNVFPQMGSARRWRSIYRVKDKAQVDELWVGWFDLPRIATGPSQTLLEVTPAPKDPGSTDRHTLRWFGKSWLYETNGPNQERWWCDGRLSLRANAFDPVFCFEMDAQDQARAKAPIPLEGSWSRTIKDMFWPSKQLRPAKEVLEDAKPKKVSLAGPLQAI